MSHPFLKKLDEHGTVLALPLLFLIITGHQTGSLSTNGLSLTIPYILLIAYIGVMTLRPWRKREKPQPAVNQQNPWSKSLVQAGLSVVLFAYAVTGPLALLRWTQFEAGIPMPYGLFAALVIGAFLLLTCLQPLASEQSAEVKVSLKPDTPIKLAGILTALLIIAATPISDTPRFADALFIWTIASLALVMGQTAPQQTTAGAETNDSASTSP